MVDNKNLEDDEIKDKIEEETLEEVKEEEQDLEDIKKVPRKKQMLQMMLPKTVKMQR